MNGDKLLKALLALLLLAVAVWLGMNTEWVDHEVRTPPKGEALGNELYVSQQLARQLGATVVKPQELDRMPPGTATLLLGSWHWDLFPERERQLRNWVQQGGHLVIEANMLDNERMQRWLPVRLTKQADEDDDDGDEEKTERKARAWPECDQVVEPDGVAHAYEGQGGDGEGFSLCGGLGHRRIVAAQTPLWAVEGRQGLEIVRMPVGRGSVTVFANSALFNNTRVLKGDNALLAMAVLQVRREREIWFVGEETRPPLLEWLWTEGWVAVLLGATALGAALWRGAVRFGPLAARTTTGRRSMAEQLTGTAQFLRHHGAQALHAAQVRALDETACGHLRDYRRLDRPSRAKAIADATGLDASSLNRALDPGLKRPDRELPATLQLLETARRSLHSRTGTRPSTESPR